MLSTSQIFFPYGAALERRFEMIINYNNLFKILRVVDAKCDYKLIDF